MSVLIIDSHATHARVVKGIVALGTYDIIYYSDTRTAPFDELSGFTRVSRLLTLLDTFARRNISAVVLMGRGMRNGPREAIELGVQRAGMKLIYAAELLAEHAHSAFLPGHLCIIGDSCLTPDDLRPATDRGEYLEIPWCRIAPICGIDESLISILKGWGKTVGGFVTATPENKRIGVQVIRYDPRAIIVDEYEVLSLAIAQHLPESQKPSLEACVSDTTPAAIAKIKSGLGLPQLHITEIGLREPAPTSGPFAMSLDFDGGLA